MPDDVAMRVVDRLRQSAKYRGLCDEILRWAAEWGLEQTASEKAALKAAKRKLHQAFGAFLPAANRKRLLSILAAASSAGESEHRTLMTEALSLHVSTAERVEGSSGGQDPMWQAVLAHAGDVRSVLDLGCGLAPAVLPWTGLPRAVHYHGFDLDAELCAALQGALRPFWPRITVQAADVRGEQPWPEVDVVVMSKLLPTLERQSTGSAARLAASLRARVVVATFPTRTLGGRDRGMASRYQALAVQVLGPGITREINGELVHIVDRL